MGALSGITIVELVGIGPGPFAGMMLADHGARVIAVDKKGGASSLLTVDINRRGKEWLELDLKDQTDRAQLLDLVKSADGLIEGFRPGVMEKLGLGPDDLSTVNPRLVYGRMTGWGQDGPMAQMAGHDINYIGLTGALHAMGSADTPPPVPLNLIGDYGGGAMMLAFGMLAALLSARETGKGAVVDAAMTDGTAALMSLFWSLKASGLWSDTRGDNFLDGGAHFYGTYACSDGRFMAVGPIEPHFMMIFIQTLGLDPAILGDHMNRAKWPDLKQLVADAFKAKPRDHWAQVFDGLDACVTPVLSLSEAPDHPHNKTRQTYQTVDGVVQPAPAPKITPFS